MSRKINDIGAFGQPSYLVKKFDDVSKAVYSHRSSASKKIAEIVKSKSTKKDNMYLHAVVATSGTAGGTKTGGYLAHVAMGLNGQGRGSDYAAALKRLLDTGKFFVVDAWIDAIDDLWDFILGYRETK